MMKDVVIQPHRRPRARDRENSFTRCVIGRKHPPRESELYRSVAASKSLKRATAVFSLRMDWRSRHLHLREDSENDRTDGT